MNKMMFQECFQKIAKDSRIRSPEKLEELNKEFSSKVSSIDPTGLSDLEVLMSAAEEMRADKKAAELKKMDTAILDAHKREAIKQSVAANPDYAANDVLLATLMSRHNAKIKVSSVEQQQRGMMRGMGAALQPLYRALSDKLGIRQSQEAVIDFADALYGGGTPEMKKIVGDMQNMFETIRVRMNKAGANIAKLDSWKTVQQWSHDEVSRAWKRHPDAQNMKTAKQQYEASLDVFADDWSKWIDYDKARDDYGNIRTEEEMRSWLRTIGEQIANEGRGSGAVKRSGMLSAKSAGDSFSRKLHVKDAVSWRESMANYGQGSIYNQIEHSINRASMQVQMFERFGSRPIQAIQDMAEEATKKLRDSKEAPSIVRTSEIKGADAVRAAKWMLADVEYVESDSRILRGIEGFKNLQFIKLGFAVITSITDVPMMMLTAAVNREYGVQKFADGLKMLDPRATKDRVMLENAGLISETFSHNIYADAQKTIDAGWTRVAGDMTIRASGLNAITQARRAAFSANLMNTLGSELSKFKKFSDLPELSRKLYEGRGIMEADWAALQKEPLGMGKYKTMLNAMQIDNVELREKVLGWNAEETNIAVLEPGMRERYMLSLKNTKGSGASILLSSFMQFKSFPITMFSKHIQRMQSLGAAGGSAYFTALMAGTTGFGAIALQANSILGGKDPRDMTDYRFWISSALKGGSLGIYGDLLFSNENQMAQLVAGPSASEAFKIAGALTTPLQKVQAGTDWAPEKTADKLMRIATGYSMPNTLWWSKGIVDRMAMSHMQEYLNPGYLERQAAKSMRDYNQDYWWRRGEFTPDRAPALERAIGQ